MSFEFFNIYTTSLILFIFLFINLNKIKSELVKNKPELASASRFYFFDFLKGISIVAVVLMHVAYFYMNGKDNLAIISDYIIKICRFAVPFFIISSGFLLSLKDFSGKSLFDFYNNKFFRLIVPYFLFCVLFFVLKNNYFNVIEFVKGFFIGDISVPYYFMSILIQLYIIYPLLIILINKFGKFKILIISFFISFISFLLLYKIGSVSLFLPYLFYFVFGIFIKDYLSNTNILSVIKNIGFFKISFVILFVYTISAIIGPFDQYSNFQFAYSIVLFLILFSSKELFEKFKIYSFICLLGKNSFYIFLIHFFIMEFIFKISNNFIIFLILSVIFGIGIPLIISLFVNKIAGTSTRVKDVKDQRS